MSTSGNFVEGFSTNKSRTGPNSKTLTHKTSDSSEFYILHPDTGVFIPYFNKTPFTSMVYIYSSFKGFNGITDFFGVTYLDNQGNVQLITCTPEDGGYGNQTLNFNKNDPYNARVDSIEVGSKFISSSPEVNDDSPHIIVKSFWDSSNNLRHVTACIDSTGSEAYSSSSPNVRSNIFYGTYGPILIKSNNSTYTNTYYISDTTNYSSVYYSDSTMTKGAFDEGALQKNFGFAPVVFDPSNYYYSLGDFAIATADDSRANIKIGGTPYSPRWMTYIVCLNNDVFFYTLDINLSPTIAGNYPTNVCNWYNVLPPAPAAYNSIRRIVYWGSGHFDFAFLDASFYNVGYDNNVLIPGIGLATTSEFVNTIVFNVSPLISSQDYEGGLNLPAFSGDYTNNTAFYISRFAGSVNASPAGSQYGNYDRTWFYLSIPTQYFGGLGNVDFCIDTYTSPADKDGTVVPYRIKVAVSGFSNLASEITKILIWDSDLNGGLRPQSRKVNSLKVAGNTIASSGLGFHPDCQDNPKYPGPAYGGMPNDNYQKGTNFWYEAPGNFSASTTMQFINHQLCVFSGGRSWYIGPPNP